MEVPNQKILGIDPGTQVMGYGLIEIRENKPIILEMGVVIPGRYEDHYQRLKVLFEKTRQLVDNYRPDVLALEAPFFGKNVQSMLKLGRAQGAIMAAGLAIGLPIFEYAPLKVKEAITGMGRASKEQVAYFLQKVYGLEELPKDLDATDAIAVAICHFIQSGKPNHKKDYKNWEDFIKKNPGKVK
jgi:crossover junction endodeoxyribonuclease RuvC